MPYTPTRGGDAPGWLRDALVEWLEAGADTVEVEVAETWRPVRWIVG